MPHQCLGCGRAFGQGDMDLLKGCPDCNGTRFFFSAKPVDESERARLKKEQDADVKTVIAQLLAENPGASPKELVKSRSWDEWVRLPAAKAGAPGKKAEVKGTAPGKGAGAAGPDAARFAAAVNPAAARKPRGTPGTVQVQGPGHYELDVEALLSHDPIVIEKNGTYMIHLPSVLDGNRASGRRKRRS